MIIRGTDGIDFLQGGSGGDTIEGLDGNDTLYGWGGDDILIGGAGNDILEGGFGADTLLGGSGDDRLLDRNAGSDLLSGGTGNDYISVYRRIDSSDKIRMNGGVGDDQLYLSADNQNTPFKSSARIVGGDGNDLIVTNGAFNFVVDGGDGDDNISVSEGRGKIDSGNGSDRVGFFNSSGLSKVATGAGNDSIYIGEDFVVAVPFDRNMSFIISTGSGQDQLQTFNSEVFFSTLKIDWLDFDTGDTGDRIDILPYLQDNLFDWNGSNPISQGFLRLFQSGEDTLLQFDRNGESGVWETLVTFRNTEKDAFTDYNFFGLHLDGSESDPPGMQALYAGGDYF